MTKEAFLRCYKDNVNRKTIFSGGSLLTNSNIEYNHIVKIEFDLTMESLCVYCMDIEHRKRFQQQAQAWVDSGRTLKTFNYPTIKIEFYRENIKCIIFPYVATQLLLPLK